MTTSAEFHAKLEVLYIELLIIECMAVDILGLVLQLAFFLSNGFTPSIRICVNCRADCHVVKCDELNVNCVNFA